MFSNRMKEPRFRKAVHDFLVENGLEVSPQLVTSPSIDCTLVCLNDEPVLVMMEQEGGGFAIELAEGAELLQSKFPPQKATPVPARAPA